MDHLKTQRVGGSGGLPPKAITIAKGSAWGTIGIVAAAVGLPGGEARAEWEAEKYLVIPVGQLTLRPSLQVIETFDSNIFYQETDEQSDLITTVRPGFSLLYGSREENFLSIAYAFDASTYLDRDDLNNTGHRVTHQSRFKFTRLSLQADDSFTATQTLLGGTFSYIERQVGSVSLTDDWKADYEISPRAVLGVRASFDWVDYSAEDLQPYHLYDYLAYGGGIRAGYRPSDKLTLFPELGFLKSELGKNWDEVRDAPDLMAYSFGGGAEGEFSPKLSGSISGGYEIRDYSDDSDIPGGWTATCLFTWQARPKTIVQLGYRHWVQVSREAVANSVDTHRASASVYQRLGTQDRWTAGLDAYYQIDDYSNEASFDGQLLKRGNDLAGASARVQYRWRAWLTTMAAYDFFVYTDNIPTIPDYEVHRFSLRVAAGY